MFLTLHEPDEKQLVRAGSLISELSQLSSNHSDLRFGDIHYVIWSDVFLCPECGNELVFWEVAVDEEQGEVRSNFECPNCSTILAKRQLDRVWTTEYDPLLGKQVSLAKQIPVRINYTYGKDTFTKKADSFDVALVRKIIDTPLPHWVPTDELKAGDKTGDPFGVGIKHSHQFFTKRNLWTLASVFANSPRNYQKWLLTGILQRGTKQHQIAISRIGGPKAGEGGATAGHRRGTLYIPSNQVEYHPIHLLEGRINSVRDAIKRLSSRNKNVIVSTQSATMLPIGDSTVDYIFIDPPFGGNIMYSELNFVWEAWLKVLTNNSSEAIQNKSQNKDLLAYQNLMSACFNEFYRVLKPGRWLTVEFHNSQNAVWSAIQEALQRAGFVVADVSTLDKQIKTHTQRTAAGSVNQDLVITAYKPNGGLEDRFRLEAGTETGVWDFVRTHLRQLPVFVSKDGQVEIVAERQDYLLFDRMVAFHVQRGVTVPLSASEFYAGLEQRFSERDSMYFLPEQVAEYDKKRMTAKEVLQLTLFVTDEASAIQWLKQQLTKKPQSFQDLHPQFMRQIAGWSKHEISLELSDLLEQNFLVYDGTGEVPSQIHGYLSNAYRDLRNLTKVDPKLRAEAKDRWYVPDPNKAGDLEKLRERALLREFDEYRESKSRKLKIFRLEAVRAGFKKAWGERDYETILAVAEKIPDAILQEDPKLLMWYDQALTRLGK